MADLRLMRSLRLRLLLMLVAAVLVAVGTVALVARGATAREFERYVERTHYELRSAADQLVEQRGGRVVFANVEGQVLADTAGELLGRQLDGPVVRRVERHEIVGLPPAEATLIARAALPVSEGGLPRPSPEDVLLIRMVPPPGVARIPGEELFLHGLNSSLLLAVAAGGGVAVLLAVLFSRRVLGPIDALTAAARRMERGDLSQRVAVDSRDEVGELGRAFNAMAESLQRTERLRRTMVSDVAHELRTPLSNLRGYLEALRDGVARPTPDLIGSLHDEALLLARLVDDLQELALAEAGRLALERAPTEVDAIVARAVQAAAGRAEVGGIHLRAELPPDLPPVDVDPTRIGQVLRNLLDNALTYTPSGGEIVVLAERAGDLVELCVRDSGIGIPPEHLPHVFERFYRVDRSRARSTGGTGIGLAIVKELVQAHGGRVEIESFPGEGTSVRFTLPMAPEPREMPAVAPVLSQSVRV